MPTETPNVESIEQKMRELNDALDALQFHLADTTGVETNNENT